jgi:hypothetical protein
MTYFLIDFSIWTLRGMELLIHSSWNENFIRSIWLYPTVLYCNHYYQPIQSLYTLIFKAGHAEHKPLIDESIYHTKHVLSPPAQISSFSVRIIDLPINPLIEWRMELLATLYACSFLNWDLGLVLSDRSTWSRPGFIYRRTRTG